MWEYLGLKAGSDGRVVSIESQVPVCRLCGKSVPAKGGNTTNLLTHQRDHHPDVYAEASPKIAKKDASSNVATVTYTNSLPYNSVLSERLSTLRNQPFHKELNHAATYFLAKDMLRCIPLCG